MGQGGSTDIASQIKLNPADLYDGLFKEQTKSSGEFHDLLKACFDRDGSVTERADMATRWPVSLDEFAILDEPSQRMKVALSPRGDIRRIIDDRNGASKGSQITMAEATRQGYQVVDLALPGTKIDEEATLLGGGQKLVIKVFSEDTPSAEPIVRRCSSTDKASAVDQVTDLVLGVLQTGAESANLSIGYEMLLLKYDKTDVMNEAEHRPRPWVVSYYIFGPLRFYRLWPTPDPLNPYYERIEQVKRGTLQAKEAIIRELRAKEFEEIEVTRFIESTGGEGSEKTHADGKSDKLLRILAKESVSRRFWLQETDHSFHPLDGQRPTEMRGRKIPPAPPHSASCGTVRAMLKELVHTLGKQAADISNWNVLIDWEALHIKTVKETLHEAQRFRMLGDEASHVRFALKVVELMKKLTPEQRNKLGKLSNTEWYSVVMANKTILDDTVDGFLAGSMQRNRFENLLEHHCVKVLDMFDGTLLPMAQYNQNLERMTMCMRQRADYLRYMHFWISARRADDDGQIEKSYKRALELTRELPSRHVIGTGVYVNLATFHAECMRDLEMAAFICRAGIQWGSRPLDSQMSPGQTFNWKLLVTNLEGFESQICVLNVVFREKDFAKHKEALGNAYQNGWMEELAEAMPNLDPEGARAYRAKKEKAEKPEEEEPHDQTEPEKAVDAPAATPEPSAGYPARPGQDPALAAGTRTDCAGEWDKAKLTAFHFANSAAGMCLDRRAFEASSPLAPAAGDFPVPPPQSPREEEDELASREHTAREPETPPDLMDRLVVLRWLRGQPLFLDDVDGNEKGEEEDDGEAFVPRQLLAQVRWVETLSRGPVTREGQNFTVACVVRLHQKALAQAAAARAHAAGMEPRSHDNQPVKEKIPNWSDVLVEAVKGWPESKATSHQIRIEDQNLLVYLGFSLSEDGVVRRSLRVDQYRLWPGETLSMTGPLEGKSPREGIAALREGHVPCPVEITFIKPMQVQSAKLLDTAPYMEQHSNFMGFREDGRNLKVSEQFTTLDDLCKVIAAERQKDQQQQMAPKRIPGLSTRRNPVLAMNRGCK
mmetsp:Transcript_70810/g.124976  ORF Transcript_70810/g.124976 Transcript_70810/m.124976 type:complete len:1055 (-) Transcript_70810:77-3241(-)